MTPKQAAATAVTTLSETFNRPLLDVAMEAYAEAIEDLGPELIAVATKRALRECRFFPSPVELRELAGVGGPKVIARQIADAWEAVVQAMRQHDYTTSVDFGPLVNAVIRNLGGWQAACRWTVSEIETWKRKEFGVLYEAFAAGPASALRGEPLAGAFTGRVERIAIGGVMPAPQLAAPPNPVSAVVRELADGHLLQGSPKVEAATTPSPSAERAAERKARRKARREADDARAAAAVEQLRARVAAEQATKVAE